jgi:hypothetical protein
MTKGHKPAGGIKSRVNVSPGIRTGSGSHNARPAGVAQLGQKQGNHITNKSATDYTGEKLHNDRSFQPVSKPRDQGYSWVRIFNIGAGPSLKNEEGAGKNMCMKSLQVPPLEPPPPVPILLLYIIYNNKNRLAGVLEVPPRAKHAQIISGNFCSEISRMLELRCLDLLKSVPIFPEIMGRG